MTSLYTLPKEMYAEIARFLGTDFPSNGFRLAAGTVQIKDIVNGRTYLNGVLHSFDDQPAIITGNGNQYWFRYGMQHRDNDLPAVIHANGTHEWYQLGKLHRTDDKPAIIHINGNQYWYQLGNIHRDNNLPAIIYASGTHEWYQLNKLHRENMPAVIYADGTTEYWLNGRQINKLITNFAMQPVLYRLKM